MDGNVTGFSPPDKFYFDLQRFDTAEVSTPDELKSAIENASDGDTIKLTDNISLSLTKSMTIDKTINLDLGEYQITTSYTETTNDNDGTNGAYCVFRIKDGGTLNVTADEEDKGGINNANNRRVFYIEGGGNLSVNHGTYVAGTTYQKVEANYTAGLIMLNPNTEYDEVFDDSGEITGYANTKPGSITLNNINVTADTYVINDLCNNWTIGDTFVNSGYTFNVNGGTYKATTKAPISQGFFQVAGTEAVFTDVDITGSKNPCIYVLNRSTATIKGDKTKLTMNDAVDTSNRDEYDKAIYNLKKQYYDYGRNVVAVSYGATLNIEGGTYNSNGYSMYVYSSGGNINVTGDATFNHTSDSAFVIKQKFDSENYGKYYAEDEIPSNVNISNGTFNIQNAEKLAVKDTSGTTAVKESLVVTGGVFSKDISAFIANDYKENCLYFDEKFYVGDSRSKMTATAYSLYIDDVTYYYSTQDNLTAAISNVVNNSAAQIGTNKYYTTFAKAYEAAANGDTIKLLYYDGYDDNTPITISKELTIDLNGQEVERTGDSAIVVTGAGGNLTLIDTSANGSGAVKLLTAETETPSGNVVSLTDGASFTLKSGKITSNSFNITGVSVAEGCTFNMTDGKIWVVGTLDDPSSSEGVGVQNSGTVNFNGGTINAREFGIDNEGGTANVNGGVIQANTGVNNNGTLNVLGGKIKGIDLTQEVGKEAGGWNIPEEDGISIEPKAVVGGNNEITITTGDSGIKMTGGTLNVGKSGKKSDIEISGITSALEISGASTINLYDGKLYALSKVTLDNDNKITEETTNAEGTAISYKNAEAKLNLNGVILGSNITVGDNVTATVGENIVVESVAIAQAAVNNMGNGDFAEAFKAVLKSSGDSLDTKQLDGVEFNYAGNAVTANTIATIRDRIYSSLDKAIDAASETAEKTVTLAQDLTISDQVNVSEDVTLNLGTKTLIFTGTGNAALKVASGKKVTLDSANNFKDSNGNVLGIEIADGATVMLGDKNFKDEIATANIANAYFQNINDAMKQLDQGEMLIAKVASTTTTTTNGNVASDEVVEPVTLSETKGSDAVFSCVKNGKTYYGTAADFTTANLAGATNITLYKKYDSTKDKESAQTITIENGVEISSNCTLTGNGNTLTYAGTTSPMIKIKSGGSLNASGGTIEATGAGAVAVEVEEGATLTSSINIKSSSTSTDNAIATAIKNAGTVTISSGTVFGGNSIAKKGIGILQTGGSLTLNGGTIRGYGNVVQVDAGSFNMSKGTIDTYAATTGAALQLNGEGVTATITGGAIGASSTSNQIDNIIQIPNNAASTSPTTLSISGGSFYSKNGKVLNNEDSNAKVAITGGIFYNKGTYTGNNIYSSLDGTTTPPYSLTTNGSTIFYATKEAYDTALANVAATITVGESVYYYTSLNTASKDFLSTYKDQNGKLELTDSGKEKLGATVIKDSVETYYEQLSDATSAYSSPAEFYIRVEKDLTKSGGYLLSVALVAEGATKNIVLDLNGHSLTRTDAGGDVITLGQSNINRKGKVTLQIINTSDKAGTIANTATTYKDHLSNSSNQGDAITVWHDQTLVLGGSATINGTTYTSNGKITVSSETQCAIMGNGSVTAATATSGTDGQNTKITINDNVEVKSTYSLGIYNPQVGSQLTINGGTISGTTGIELRAGTLTVKGGTISSTANSYSCNPNGNGTTTTGAGIAISQHTTRQSITANISGGTIEGVVGLSITNPQDNPSGAGDLKVGITGGTFNSTKGTPIATGNADDRVSVNISEGTFNGKLMTAKQESGETLTQSSLSEEISKGRYNITGGVFSYDVSNYIADDYKENYQYLDGKTFVGASKDKMTETAYSLYVDDVLYYYSTAPIITDGKIQVGDEDKANVVAQIGTNKYYTTFDNAKAKAASGDTIKLLAAAEISSESNTITNELTIDLNGKTLTGSSGITVSGTLNVIDSAGGSGTLAAAITNSGIVKVSNGKISSTVTNNGTFTMTGGSIETSSGNGIDNNTGGTVNFNGGQIKTNGIGISNRGTNNVNGGSIFGMVGIKMLAGILGILGGKIRGYTNGAIKAAQQTNNVPEYVISPEDGEETNTETAATVGDDEKGSAISIAQQGTTSDAKVAVTIGQPNADTKADIDIAGTKTALNIGKSTATDANAAPSVSLYEGKLAAISNESYVEGATESANNDSDASAISYADDNETQGAKTKLTIDGAILKNKIDVTTTTNIGSAETTGETTNSIVIKKVAISKDAANSMISAKQSGIDTELTDNAKAFKSVFQMDIDENDKEKDEVATMSLDGENYGFVGSAKTEEELSKLKDKEAGDASVAKIGDSYYSGLAEAIAKASANDEITLSRNINTANQLTLSDGMSLNLDGKTFTYTGGGNAALTIAKNAKVTLDTDQLLDSNGNVLGIAMPEGAEVKIGDTAFTKSAKIMTSSTDTLPTYFQNINDAMKQFDQPGEILMASITSSTATNNVPADEPGVVTPADATDESGNLRITLSGSEVELTGLAASKDVTISNDQDNKKNISLNKFNFGSGIIVLGNAGNYKFNLLDEGDSASGAIMSFKGSDVGEVIRACW